MSPKRKPGSGWKPPLKRHARGQGYCRLEGRNHYFGRWPADQRDPPPEVLTRYNAWIAEWAAAGCAAPPASGPHVVTVAELLLAFWKWARDYYRRNSKPTAEVYCFRSVVKIL